MFESVECFARCGKGLLFNLQFAPAATWRLSNGLRLDDQVARIVLTDPHVQPLDRSLFPSTHSQTFQYRIQIDVEESS
jgi:hypothetical protein